MLDLDPSQIDGPLAQFNHTRATRDDTLKMVRDINSALGDDGLAPDALTRQFKRTWPELEEELERVRGLDAEVPEGAPRGEGEMLGELLELVRQQSRDLSVLRREPSGLTSYMLPSSSTLKSVRSIPLLGAQEVQPTLMVYTMAYTDG